jgi:hypothetical protein
LWINRNGDALPGLHRDVFFREVKTTALFSE